jgi:hypothetical protein
MKAHFPAAALVVSVFAVSAFATDRHHSDSSGVGRRAFWRTASRQNRACHCEVSGFEWHGWRYEQRLRDIRLAPALAPLPGSDFGRRDIIPVLPPRHAGFFVFPVR